MGVRLNGSTSGYVELNAPAVAGTTTLELPTDSIKPGVILLTSQAFSAASSVSVNNCFTTTYDAYRVIFSLSAAVTQGQLRFRFRASGSDAATGNYFGGYSFAGNSSTGASSQGAQSHTYLCDVNPTYPYITGGVIDIPRSPASSSNGPIFGYLATGHNGSQTISYQGGFLYNVTGAYDGFSIIKETGTFTGTVRVFGFRSTL